MTQAKLSQHPSRISVDSYLGFAGLPPLVGLQAMGEAATTGLTVTESVARLKRVHGFIAKFGNRTDKVKSPCRSQ
jgi:hypothetical protein